MNSDQAQHIFFSGGTQYYIAGRYGACAALSPVAGNLMHHTIEHFMKGGLVKTKSLEELAKKPFGHNLPEIWKAFKAQAKDPNLSRFDHVISKLHDFEDIRYPEGWAKGARIRFNITKAAAAAVTRTYRLGEVVGSAKGRLLINTIDSNTNDPNGWGPGRGWEILPDHIAQYYRAPVSDYELILEEIDELVAAIFAATNINLQFYFRAAFRPDAWKYVVKDNNVRAIVDAVPALKVAV